MLLSELQFLDFEARLDSRSSRVSTVRNTQVGSCIKLAVSDGAVVGRSVGRSVGLSVRPSLATMCLDDLPTVVILYF